MAFSFTKLLNPAGLSGKADAKTGTMHTTPWSWRTEDGVYVGLNGQVWLFYVLPAAPLVWEDPQTKLQIGGPLESAIVELGDTSRRPLGDLRILGDNREIHLAAVMWEEIPKPPVESSKKLAEFLDHTFWFLAPQKLVFLGVQLRTRGVTDVNHSESAFQSLRRTFTQAMTDDVPDLSLYQRDKEQIAAILGRNGCRRPRPDEFRYLEGWYNQGRGTDAVIVEEPSGKTIQVGGWGALEMSALIKFRKTVLRAPDDAWASDAFTHAEGCVVMSVRGDLEPAEVARKRARQSQRKAMAQIEEQAKTGDLERVEDAELYGLAKGVEDYFASGTEPLLTNCSIVMGRRARPADDTYIDYLRAAHGIDVKPLEHRQLQALDETLPCSNLRLGRTKPFAQDLSTGMIAYSGIGGFSALGDSTGVFIGLAMPDMTPVFLDPAGASKADQPPGMAVVGEPGSGKTFLCQLLCYQTALNGRTAILINPKSADSLKPFAHAVGGEVVSMAALEQEGGALDPFRYAPGLIAAEIATAHILSVLREYTEDQELDLASGLKEGAERGATCVGQALDYVADKTVRGRIVKACKGSTLFGLGVSWEPRPPLGIGGHRGLTLIEFDRPLSLPDASTPKRDYSRDEATSVAAMQLVTRASLEILIASQGGTLVVDEAWTFLSSKEGLKALQRLGREGRSQQILPVFATQRLADLIREGVDLQSYLSRVLALKMTDPVEAKASLSLVGLEANSERMRFLATAGAVRATEDTPGRGALGLHKDLKGRHCAVMVGPVPPEIALLFSTNPEDRAKRDQLRTQRLVEGASV